MVKFKALQSAKVTEKVTVKVTDGVTEKVLDTLTESEKKVLEILDDNPLVTYMEIADKLSVSRKTVSQKIKMLKDKGIIIRVGSAKKGYWKKVY